MPVSLLFIDEEIPDAANIRKVSPTPPMQYYIIALRENHDRVTFKVARSVDEARIALVENPKGFDVVSIDVLMPPGEHLKKSDTGNATRTGLVFLNWMIEQNIHTSVVLLSNVSESSLRELVPAHVGQIRSLRIAEKKNTTPFEFVDIVLELGEPK